MMESTNATKSLKRLVELEALNAKQGKRISELEEAASLDAAQKFLFREFAMEAESDLDVIQAAWCDFDAIVEALQAKREPKDICPVCMTWSWAPCDEGDEGAEQRGEEWALCQCCNDSRIAVLWKGKCDAAYTGLLGASRSECIAWGRRERQPEIDKLREGCEARDIIIRIHARHTYGCPAGGTMDNDCTCDYEKRMAALGEGGGG